jgi:nicotinamidase-related amidase
MKRVFVVWVALAVVISISLALVGEEPAAISGCSTALLVIDVQNAYVPAGGLPTADGASLVERLVAVLARARAAHVPIVYVRHWEPRFADGNPLGDFVPAIAPQAGDPVIWKTMGDGFANTDLKSILTGLGVGRVLLTGLATHACVNETVFGALNGHYETWVLADAHGDVAGSALEAYYNAAWPTYGVHVAASGDIDFAAFGCSAAETP